MQKLKNDECAFNFCKFRICVTTKGRMRLDEATKILPLEGVLEMLEYIEGDIFNSPAQVLVNTVNTVGVMGKGLALSFKKRYPDMFDSYRKACEKHQFHVGKLMLCYAPDHWILLFPTKANWRNPSKMEYLEEGLNKFVNTYAEKGISSIAFPKLGCGNGELSWCDVKPVMERYLRALPITIYVYVGTDITQTPEHIAQQETIEWLKKNARDMSFNGVCDDLMHECSLLPYRFNDCGLLYTAEWNDGLCIADVKGMEYKLSEDDLFQAWDTIRNQGIVSTVTIGQKDKIFYAMLHSKGYISPIKIISIQGDEERMSDGYQINAGYGRAFAVQECV